MLNKIKQLGHFFIAIFTYYFYGRPARKLIVVGVTGTKGKSTTCRLMASVLEAAGYKVGLASTVEFQVGEKRWLNKKKMSMLGRGETQKLLRDMVKAGCEYAVIETSSQGILQYRHFGLHYDVAVFTNLANEHVEAHGGFENLRRDKGKIFAGLKKEKNKIINGRPIPKIIIANADDTNADYFIKFPADYKWAFSLKDNIINGVNYNVSGQLGNTSEKGSDFLVDNVSYHLNIPGDFNVYNGLAGVTLGLSQGIAVDKIAKGLASVLSVEGRMEYVEAGQNFKVIVDYAHEALSLTELFKSLRKMLKENKKLIAVVGSDGGGRDVGKRENMGEIAGKMADYVVITDVNCFDEDPKEIAEMIAKGARKAGKVDGQNLFIEVDRRKGIEMAIGLAGSGDIVAITAKGTEPCIMVGKGKKIPWDDRQVAREILDIRNSKPEINN